MPPHLTQKKVTSLKAPYKASHNYLGAHRNLSYCFFSSFSPPPSLGCGLAGLLTDLRAQWIVFCWQSLGKSPSFRLECFSPRYPQGSLSLLLEVLVQSHSTLSITLLHLKVSCATSLMFLFKEPLVFSLLKFPHMENGNIKLTLQRYVDDQKLNM